MALHKQFSFMLIVICFISAITLLTSSYYFIHFIGKKYVVVSSWDAMEAIDSFIRFCLIGHIADQMQNAVKLEFVENDETNPWHKIDSFMQASDCIPVLRQIRDEFNWNEGTSLLKRRQVGNRIFKWVPFCYTGQPLFISFCSYYQITLFIIEITTNQKSINKISLLGILSINRHLALKVRIYLKRFGGKTNWKPFYFLGFRSCCYLFDYTGSIWIACLSMLN